MVGGAPALDWSHPPWVMPQAAAAAASLLHRPNGTDATGRLTDIGASAARPSGAVHGETWIESACLPWERYAAALESVRKHTGAHTAIITSDDPRYIKLARHHQKQQVWRTPPPAEHPCRARQPRAVCVRRRPGEETDGARGCC